jgi:hypothetical protein
MSTTTEGLVARLQRLAAKGATINLHDEVGRLTMQIVGTAAYGCARFISMYE